MTWENRFVIYLKIFNRLYISNIINGSGKFAFLSDDSTLFIGAGTGFQSQSEAQALLSPSIPIGFLNSFMCCPQLHRFKNVPTYFKRADTTFGNPNVLTGKNQEMLAPSVFNIFPNPANNKLTFLLPELKIYNLLIIDCLGRIVISQIIRNRSEINIKDLKPGIYSTQLIFGSQILFGKFVKDH